VGRVPYQQDGDEGFHAVTQEGNFTGMVGTVQLDPSKDAAIHAGGRCQRGSAVADSGEVQQYSLGVQRELDKVTKLT